MYLTKNEIEIRMSCHQSLPEQVARYAAIRTKARDLADAINEECPECREAALAMTNLEQAVLWANAAITRRIP